MEGCEKAKSALTDFNFGIQKNDFGLKPDQAFIARKELAAEIAKISLPQVPLELDANWLWYQPAHSVK